MLIPRLSKQRSQSDADRASDKSIVRLCVLGLLCLLGAAQAFAGTTYDPKIDLTQTVDQVSANGDGTFSVQVTLTVKNAGNEKLVKLQILDKLDFVEPFRIHNVGRPQVLSGELTVNPD